jgi:gliding motility-associated-like protein
MKQYLVILATTLAFLSCKKAKMEESCTTNNARIITKDYNADSVNIFCPTAFTPNGDGLNDVFRPIGTGFEVQGFEITKGSRFLLNGQNLKEWDGTYGNGSPFNEGVYLYEFQLLTRHNDQVTVVGEITLSRSTKYDLCNCLYEDMVDSEIGFVKVTQEKCRE